MSSKKDSIEKGTPGRPKKDESLSTRSDDAKTIKITAYAWEILRRSKFELESSSYSDAIIWMHTNPGKGSSEISTEIRSKIPKNQKKFSKKTIVISKKAHDILRQLKYHNYLDSYSEAISNLEITYRNPNL